MNQTPEERIAAESYAKRTERLLRTQIDGLEAEVKELRALANFYDLARTEPIVVPDWRKPGASKAGKKVGTVMAQIADWHLGEVVKPEQIMGLNAFNTRIAERRVDVWTGKVIDLPRKYVNGLEIEGLIIPATGDMFTGEIHPELIETNDMRVLPAMLHWMERVISVVETLAGEYRYVEIDAVPGNHTRNTEKYDHKDRVDKSYEQFFWSVVKARIADRGKVKNVTINVSPSANYNLSIYGRNHLLDHGYEFKGGSGISGSFSPLMLGAHRKNRRQMRADMPMHTMVIGHLHQIINIPGVIMGGCLKGYDEFAFNLNLDPDPEGAGQAMWITSPERAQVVWMPIYVVDRKAEGW